MSVLFLKKEGCDTTQMDMHFSRKAGLMVLSLALIVARQITGYRKAIGEVVYFLCISD